MKINALPPDVLLSHKIFAILNRSRPMGKDFYDVIFLFSKTNPSYYFFKREDEIERRNRDRRDLKKLLLKCEKINFKKLIEDVTPFLFYPSEAEKIKLFPDFIQTKIE